MSINFADVTDIAIPSGDVTKITRQSDAAVLWEKITLYSSYVISISPESVPVYNLAMGYPNIRIKVGDVLTAYYYYYSDASRSRFVKKEKVPHVKWVRNTTYDNYNYIATLSSYTTNSVTVTKLETSGRIGGTPSYTTVFGKTAIVDDNAYSNRCYIGFQDTDSDNGKRGTFTIFSPV